FYGLIEHMLPEMLSFDEKINPVPSRILSRVRRDTRFTRNKDLYRDHAWLMFRRPKQRIGSSLTIYFEVTQEGWGYGIGYYDIPRPVMDEVRQMILKEDRVFLDAFAAAQRNPKFQLYGEQYKRPRYPDAPEQYQPWLNSKNIGLSFESDDFECLFQGDFYDMMIADLKRIRPFFDFLRAAESRVAHHEGEYQ
ncbi:MAG: DUF2461 family protein, partial [Butyricicoccaceae bacterium]